MNKNIRKNIINVVILSVLLGIFIFFIIKTRIEYSQDVLRLNSEIKDLNQCLEKEKDRHQNDVNRYNIEINRMNELITDLTIKAAATYPKLTSIYLKQIDSLRKIQTLLVNDLIATKVNNDAKIKKMEIEMESIKNENERLRTLKDVKKMDKKIMEMESELNNLRIENQKLKKERTRYLQIDEIPIIEIRGLEKASFNECFKNSNPTTNTSSMNYIEVGIVYSKPVEFTCDHFAYFYPSNTDRNSFNFKMVVKISQGSKECYIHKKIINKFKTGNYKVDIVRNDSTIKKIDFVVN